MRASTYPYDVEKMIKGSHQERRTIFGRLPGFAY